MARVLSAMLLPVSFGVATDPVGLGEMPLRATNFHPYPGYVGELTVSGTVTVGRAQIGTQVMFFDLSDVDTTCTTDQDHSGVDDACGIKIHSGFSCSEAGPQYYSQTVPVDPWKHVQYSSVQNKAIGRNVYVTTGITLADLANRAVIVYDSAGERVACAQLNKLTETGVSLVPRFSPYPGYHGELVVQGNVEIAQDQGVGIQASQSLRFNLTGIDLECLSTTNVAMVHNGCGIHILTAKSCAEASQSQVGNLYDTGNILADPWANIRYVGGTGAREGTATGVSTPVVTGVAISGVVGKTMVVYDATGAGVACAVIQAKPNTTGSIVALAAGGPSPSWLALAVAAVLTRMAF